MADGSLLSLPQLLLLIYLFRDRLKSMFGPEVGVFLLIVFVIGCFRWMPVARLVRAQFFSLREEFAASAAVLRCRARSYDTSCPTRSGR